MRGLGSQVSTHYGTITHSSAGLGILQGDAIRNITGTQYFQEMMGGVASSGVFYVSSSTYVSNTWRVSGGGYSVRTAFDASRVVPTSGENRPINRAVIYLIKAT